MMYDFSRRVACKNKTRCNFMTIFFYLNVFPQMGSYCRSGKSVLVSRSFRNESIMSFFGHIVSSYLSHHIRMRKMAKWQRKLSVNYCGNFYRTLTPKNNKKPSTSKWIEIVWNDLTNSSTSSSIFISKFSELESIAEKFP